MLGTVPDGNDFQFVANGYKCAVGLIGGLDFGVLALTKEVTQGGGGSGTGTWEHVLTWNADEFDVQQPPFNGDHAKFIREFLALANIQLADAVGGNPTIPDIPEGHFDKLVWLCKNKITYIDGVLALDF